MTPTATHTQSVILPLRLVSESNQREHWATKARRVKQQRSTTWLLLRATLGAPSQWPLPLTITITRVAPRLLDTHDNLCASAKAVADGISDFLAGEYSKGQDRQDGLVFRYAQRRGKPKEYAVEIRVERDNDFPFKSLRRT